MELWASVFLLALMAPASCRTLPSNHEFHKNDLDIARQPDHFSLSALKDSRNVVVESELINITATCPLHPFPAHLPEELPQAVNSALDAVEARLKEVAASQGIPSFTASVSFFSRPLRTVTDGHVFLNGSSHGPPPTEDTIYRIGSITKVFAVITLFQAAERALIEAVTAPISDTYPGFSVRNRFTDEPLTWDMLATQLGGLPREAPCDPYACFHTNEQMVERLRDTEAILPPWTRPSYSNLGFSVIGRLLEPALGMTWEEWVKNEIFTPLGMNSTTVVFDPSMESDLAHSYDRRGRPVVLSDLGWSRPAGAIFSTLRDMQSLAAHFVSAVNNVDSPILSATSMKHMMLPAYLNQDGWSLWAHPFESMFIQSYLVRCKGGNIDSYSAVMCMCPELGLAFNAQWAASMDEFTEAVEAFEVLIGPIRDAIASYPPKLAVPPNYQSYLGRFSRRKGSGIGAVAVEYNEVTHTMMLSQGSTLQFRLQWAYEDSFAIVPIPGDVNCFTNELGAYPGELLQYSSSFDEIYMPGFNMRYYRVL